MTRRIIPRPEAERDLLEIFAYLGEESPQAAERFLDAVEATLGRIAARPGLGAPLNLDDPRLADLRVCSVSRFKSYLIFYRATDDEMDVVRVLHGARDDIGPLLGESVGPA